MKINRKGFKVPYKDAFVDQFSYSIGKKFVKICPSKSGWHIAPVHIHLRILLNIISDLNKSNQTQSLEQFTPQEPPRFSGSETRLNTSELKITEWVQNLIGSPNGIKNLIDQYFYELRSISRKLYQESRYILPEWDDVLSKRPDDLKAAALNNSIGAVLSLVRYASSSLPNTHKVLHGFICDPTNHSKLESAVWGLSRSEILFFIDRKNDQLHNTIGEMILATYSNPKNRQKLEELILGCSFSFYLALYHKVLKRYVDEDLDGSLGMKLIKQVSILIDDPQNRKNFEIFMATLGFSDLILRLPLIKSLNLHPRMFSDPKLHWAIIAKVLSASPINIERALYLSKSLDLGFPNNIKLILDYENNLNVFIANLMRQFKNNTEKCRTWIQDVSDDLPSGTGQRMLERLN